MQQKQGFKHILCAALAAGMLFFGGCAQHNPEKPDTADSATAVQTPPATEQTAQKPEPPAKPETYDFPELVERLSPVAAWNMNSAGEEGTVADVVGGIKGTLVNCDFAQGWNGTGVQTYSKEHSYVRFEDGTLGSLLNGKQAVTFSMWVMPYVNYGDTYRLLTVQVNNKAGGFHVYYKTGSIIVGGRSCGSDPFVSKEFKYSLDDGTVKSFEAQTNEGRWQHLTVTFDFPKDKILLTVNGNVIYALSSVNFGEESFRLGHPTDADAFGGAETANTLSFNGVIDEVMIFDRALQQEEIKQLSNEEGVDNSPVADQKLIEKMLEKLGSGAAFFKDSNLVMHGGMLERVEPSDYGIKTVFRNGRMLIPTGTARRYFEKIPQNQTEQINGTDCLDLSVLCRENGKDLLFYRDMAVVSSKASPFDADHDKVLLERMRRFFTETGLYSNLECEQSRVEVAKTGDFGTVKYCQSPSIAVRGNEIFQTMDSYGDTYVYKSTDGGKTFIKLAMIPNFNYATAFVHNGKLWLLGRTKYKDTAAVGICSSEDGVHWTEMKEGQGIFAVGDSNAHGAPTPVLFANGRIYKAYGRQGKSWKEKCAAFMVSAPMDSDWLNPKSWTVSKDFDFASSMFTSHKNGSDVPKFAYIEEGNAVLGRDGTVYGIYRVNSQPDSGYAVILKLSEDGTAFSFEKNHPNSVIRFDGGVTKFSIRYDPATDLYLALVNSNTAKEGVWQRNVLSLAVSKDLFHWTTLDTVLSDRTVMNAYVSMANHGFQYVDWVIDGEDILLSVRESMGDSVNFHNANYLTFYRLENYKKLVKTVAEEGKIR